MLKGEGQGLPTFVKKKIIDFLWTKKWEINHKVVALFGVDSFQNNCLDLRINEFCMVWKTKHCRQRYWQNKRYILELHISRVTIREQTKVGFRVSEWNQEVLNCSKTGTGTKPGRWNLEKQELKPKKNKTSNFRPKVSGQTRNFLVF